VGSYKQTCKMGLVFSGSFIESKNLVESLEVSPLVAKEFVKCFSLYFCAPISNKDGLWSLLRMV
jgi:hypothetical protein